jgi:hypothetical protein
MSAQYGGEQTCHFRHVHHARVDLIVSEMLKGNNNEQDAASIGAAHGSGHIYARRRPLSRITVKYAIYNYAARTGRARTHGEK